MEKDAAIRQIQEACKQIGLQMMKVHPAVPGLGDAGAQEIIYKAAHQLTVELEVIKKHVIRVKNAETDDQPDL
ncbi:hypothetical protein BH23VER1_BH23VER1_15000 [soil metagenome]